MKKKIIIFGIITIAIIVVAVLALTNKFTKGVITGKLYQVDNVYEEIYNMVISERNGTRTVLSTSVEGSKVDYDFGLFSSIGIPVNDAYWVVLSFNNPEELRIWLFENNHTNDDCACYVYNYKSNTLYGNQEEARLIEIFLSPYFSWVGSDGKFNPENYGNYTFVYSEYPLSHK